MTRTERIENAGEKLLLFSGILFCNQNFEEGNSDEITYDFSCPEYQELKTCYQLERIAGKGSDFNRAKRLLHHFAPKLHHGSWYDNRIEFNALKLLEYSLNNKEHGINCLSKSKILEECCLAIGIYARRVFIMPYSPYDFDNHVVIEIYDSTLNKWIMLDPTTDGYFVDKNKTPLSLLEMRQKFANDSFVTFVSSTDRLKDVNRSREKNTETNAYICKNLFYFMIDKECTFGLPKSRLIFCPKGYSLKEKDIANLKFRYHHIPAEYESWKSEYEKALIEAEKAEERTKTNLESMLKSPIKKTVPRKEQP